MIHGIEKLVLVDEASKDEIEEASQEDTPRFAENAVHNADDENKHDLRKVEAVAKHRRLYKLRII